MDEKQYQSSLDELEKKYRGKTVVADLYQLGVSGKGFTRDMRKLNRAGMKVTIEYFLEMSRQWENSGKMFEINEATTEALQNDLKAHGEKLRKRDEAQTIAAQNIAGALTNMAKGATLTQPPAAQDNKVHGVDLDNSITEIVGEVIPGNWLFTGSKSDCEKFVTDNPAK